jgi:RNA polymerase sigma factor (sigma-70 family)
MSRPVPSSGERHPPRPVTAREGVFDAAACDELFRLCAADVHAYAISLLGDRAAAEDVTALAFERLYRSRRRLDSRRGTPRAWLFAIARNAALDELRRRRRWLRQERDDERSGDPDASAASDAEGALERTERRATVRSALASVLDREEVA